MIQRISKLKTPRPLPSQSLVQKAVRCVFRHERESIPGDITIIFMENPALRRINKKFLKHDRNTDVIAFNYDQSLIKFGPAPFGDVFISVTEANKNARRFGAPLKQELIRLVVHGTLHLLGHSDAKPRAKKTMWNKQEKIVKRLSLSSPQRTSSRRRPSSRTPR